MKATELLRSQHEKVLSALKAVIDGDEGPDALDEIADDLVAHMAIEQQLFYPAVREIAPALVDESYEEHALAELELKRVLESKLKPYGYRVKAHVLLDVLQHHIDEEQDELFPAVEDVMSVDALDSLGTQMESSFEETRGAGYASALPDGFARTSSDEAKRTLFGVSAHT